MRLGVLFSGGKDSVLALHKAASTDQVVCLITVTPSNLESYLFHTPNLHLTKLQAEAMRLPLVSYPSEGVEEEEVEDLSGAVRVAIEEHGIEGVVTGAVESVYQATRIQRVCDALDLWCFNPLWQMDQMELLRELLDEDYTVIVSGVFAPPLDIEWLGRTVDHIAVDKLGSLWSSHGINPAGEGGEVETTVLDAPMFRERIEVLNARKEFGRDSGVLLVYDAELVPK